ncbi:MAG: SpoIID/LytB domain-containing protein, partial [Mycobacterium leprae]
TTTGTTGTGTTGTGTTGTGTTPAPTPTPTPTPAPIPVPAEPTSPVRIGLGRFQTGATITAPGGIYVVADGVVQWQAPVGTPVQVSLSGNQIQVAGVSKSFAGPVRLVPVLPATTTTSAGSTTYDPSVMPPGSTTPFVPPQFAAPANYLSYNKVNYRDEIDIVAVGTANGPRFSVVNEVNLEEYLLGVVPSESPSGWPIEALKAQAVASRTYARKHLGQYADEGFDIVATDSSQVYRGLSAETLSTNQAVAATMGQVVTYNGQIISAFFFASSGGHTENNEIIWTGGTPSPYLRGVEDYDNQPGNPNYSWHIPFSVDQFTAKVKAAGYNVGQVILAMASGDIGVSGRPSFWRIVGQTTSAVVSGNELRNILGLKSSPFSIDVQPGGTGPNLHTYASTDTVKVVGAGGTVTGRTVSGTKVLGASGVATTVTTGVTTRGQDQTVAGGFTVNGGGNGHAIGMSQWGAYGMALQGKTYVEILTHYYTGTKVEIVK